MLEPPVLNCPVQHATIHELVRRFVILHPKWTPCGSMFESPVRVNEARRNECGRGKPHFGKQRGCVSSNIPVTVVKMYDH